MNVLQHTRNELNLRLKENRPDRSYRDTLLRLDSRKKTILTKPFCKQFLSPLPYTLDILCGLNALSNPEQISEAFLLYPLLITHADHKFTSTLIFIYDKTS